MKDRSVILSTMNPAKCNEKYYINFLVATQQSYSCLEAEKTQGRTNKAFAHDALNRLLLRRQPSSSPLWSEAQPHIDSQRGVWVVDDTVLDKPYANKIELAGKHWSGKHKRVVKGITLVTLLWTEGQSHIPCDYRIYDKLNDKMSQKDHFRSMITESQERGLSPECVLFDSWYSGLDKLKMIGHLGWTWLTRLKMNRRVNADSCGLVPINQVAIGADGLNLHLKGYGWGKVFKIAAKNGSIEYWATNDLEMSLSRRCKFSR